MEAPRDRRHPRCRLGVLENAMLIALLAVGPVEEKHFGLLGPREIA